MWSNLSIHAPIGSVASAAASVAFISVDPWTYGTNDNGDFLSFPNAVEDVISRIDSTSMAALGIAVTAASLHDFITVLNSFNAVFPTQAWLQLGRRATQMSTLDVSKMNLVPNQKHGGSMAMNSLPAVRSLMRAELIKSASDAASTYQSSNPAGNLTNFRNTKNNHDAMVASVQSVAANGLSGNIGYRFYATGNVASALRVGHPGYEYTYTAIQLFLGTEAGLSVLAGIFQ